MMHPGGPQFPDATLATMARDTGNIATTLDMVQQRLGRMESLLARIAQALESMAKSLEQKK